MSDCRWNFLEGARIAAQKKGAYGRLPRSHCLIILFWQLSPPVSFFFALPSFFILDIYHFQASVTDYIARHRR
jgi:hypothetical protein